MLTCHTGPHANGLCKLLPHERYIYLMERLRRCQWFFSRCAAAAIVRFTVCMTRGRHAFFLFPIARQTGSPILQAFQIRFQTLLLIFGQPGERNEQRRFPSRQITLAQLDAHRRTPQQNIHAHAESAGQRNQRVQAGQLFAGFIRADGFLRHAQFGAQAQLCPVLYLAQLTEPVLHP